MNTSSSNVAMVSNVNAPIVNEKRTAITDNERANLAKAFATIHGIVKTMGRGETDIGDNFATNLDTLGELLACAHRVWKLDGEARAAKEREAFSSKIDALIQVALDKKAKIIATYMSQDEEYKSEVAPPKPTVSIFVSDFLPIFGTGYDLAAATKALHDMGYMVHVAKVDGRRKEQDTTPPYLTATVGQPIRRAAK